MSAARDALTDPVRVAVETLLSTGARGRPDSDRDEVRVIVMRARRALDGVPVTGAEAEGFPARATELYQGDRDEAWRQVIGEAEGRAEL